jgi:DNA-binding NtrC family response regulator
VERSWSREASEALDAYPWTSPAEKAKARAEAELVSFGAEVECDDLPLAVRRWLKRQARPRHVWRGETLKAATAAFEADIISQALAAHGGNMAAAARALGSTPRIVAYKARKYNLKQTTGKR